MPFPLRVSSHAACGPLLLGPVVASAYQQWGWGGALVLVCKVAGWIARARYPVARTSHRLLSPTRRKPLLAIFHPLRTANTIRSGHPPSFPLAKRSPSACQVLGDSVLPQLRLQRLHLVGSTTYAVKTQPPSYVYEAARQLSARQTLLSHLPA